MAFYYKTMHNTPLYSDVNISGHKVLDLHLLGPVIAYGEEGEAGQVLTAQGGNKPPKWEDATRGSGDGIYGGSGNIPANTVATVSGNKFTLDYSSGADAILISNIASTLTLSAPDGLSKVVLNNGTLQARTDDYLLDFKDGAGVTFTDGAITTKGIEYAADYSSGFTNRSLVDKGYVLSAITTYPTTFTAGSVIFSNGTTLTQDNSNFYYDDLNDRLGLGTTSPVAKLSVRRDNIGVTQDNSYGIILNNTTAATSGNQQMSPPIVWRGQGWKTNATAASQTVDFRADVLPMQGTANPTGTWQLASSINGGAYTTINTINSDGGVNILYNSATGSMIDIRRIGTSDRYITFGATGKFDTKSIEVSTSAYSFASGVNNTNTTGSRLFCNFTSNFSPTSGTATYSTMEILSTINQTGGANGITRGLYVNPTLTAAAD